MSDITPADALRELGDDQAEYAAAAAKKLGLPESVEPEHELYEYVWMFTDLRQAKIIAAWIEERYLPIRDRRIRAEREEALTKARSDLDGLRDALEVLISDWQSNGNSRALGDPTADVWHACAQALLYTIPGEPLDTPSAEESP